MGAGTESVYSGSSSATARMRELHKKVARLERENRRLLSYKEAGGKFSSENATSSRRSRSVDRRDGVPRALSRSGSLQHIPGYGGHIPRKCADNVYGKTFAAANTH